jgi:hypothetical protein
MYAKDGSKVGEVAVLLDIHYKRHAQRTSFELNELLSQTDPTLQLYPSDASRSGGCDALGVSFLSASEDVSSVLQLSTVLEASREGGWSTTCTSSNGTHYTTPKEERQRQGGRGREEREGEHNATSSSSRKASPAGHSSSSLSADRARSILMSQGSEAAERLVQMLAEAEAEDAEDRRGQERWAMEQRAAAAAPCRAPLTAGRATVLESVSEHAAMSEHVVSGASKWAGESLCCDSSAIQRGGMSGAGSIVEVDGGSNDEGINLQCLQGRDRDQHLDENTYVEGKNFLDFSLERSTSGVDGAHDRKNRTRGTDGGGGGGGGGGCGGGGAHAHSESLVDVTDERQGEKEGGGSSGAAVSKVVEMDVLSKLLDKGRQMLSRLDRLAQAQHEEQPSSLSVAQGACASGDGSSLLGSATGGKISESLVEDLGSSLLMSDFEEVHAGLVDDLCRIGLDVEEDAENGTLGSGTTADAQNCSPNTPVGQGGNRAETWSGVGQREVEGDFALSVHLALVSIGGGRTTALRTGDLILLHTVLMVPAGEGESVCATAHEQLRVTVPPELPEGAAVSVNSTVRLPLTPAQAQILKSTLYSVLVL